MTSTKGLRLAGVVALCALLASPFAVAQDEDPPEQPPPNKASETENADDENSDPLDLFNGAFRREETDIRVPGRGLDFEWTRTYRSRTGPLVPDTPMGNRWDHCYNIYLTQNESDLVLHDGSGRIDTYTYGLDKPGRWTARGFFNELELVSGR